MTTCSLKAGTLGYTSNLANAGAFETEEEAIEAGREHCDPGFVVMRDSRRNNRKSKCIPRQRF